MTLIASDSTPIQAHRSVLSAVCHYFFALFNGPYECENIIHLENIDGETLEELIEYIYTSNINVHEKNVWVSMLIQLKNIPIL